MDKAMLISGGNTHAKVLLNVLGILRWKDIDGIGTKVFLLSLAVL